MEQINPDFLLIIAPISATLMGFAFLGPMVRIASPEFFSRLSRYMRTSVIYERILLHGSFALWIFFWPFLISLLLLINYDGGMKISIKAVSIVFALSIFLCHWRWLIPTRARPEFPKLMDIIFLYIPRITLVIYAYYACFAIYYWNFALFVYITVLLFIALGLLFLVDSLLTPIDKALALKTSDISPDFKEEVKACFQNIRNAIKAREDQVKGLERLHSPREEKEWHRKIAEYYSGIIILREQLEGPADKRFNGLKQDWEEIEKKLAKEECPLSEVSAFGDRKERILEEYIPEFERVTREIDLLVERLGK